MLKVASCGGELPKPPPRLEFHRHEATQPQTQTTAELARDTNTNATSSTSARSIVSFYVDGKALNVLDIVVNLIATDEVPGRLR